MPAIRCSTGRPSSLENTPGCHFTDGTEREIRGSHWATRSVCPILAHVRQTIVQRIIEDRRRACDIPGTARIVRGLAMTGVVHCSAAGRSKPCQPVSDEPGLLIQETVPAFDSGRSDKRAQ